MNFPTLSTPSNLSYLREARAPLDIASGAMSGSWLPRPTLRDRGEAVVLPGFGSGPSAMFAVKRTLRNVGFRARDWDQGFNSGDVETQWEAFSAGIAERFQRTGKTVTLVGWSLGGYIARETARDQPDAVSKVITLGTPVYGGPRYSTVANVYQRRGFDLDDIEQTTIERYQDPIRVPVVALYSRNDGIVNWEACIDHWSPQVEHIEVNASHLGMGFARESLRVLAKIA